MTYLSLFTMRDSVGLVGDYFLNPLSYVEYSETWVAVKGFDLVNQTFFHIGEYEALKNPVDPSEAMPTSGSRLLSKDF